MHIFENYAILTDDELAKLIARWGKDFFSDIKELVDVESEFLGVDLESENDEEPQTIMLSTDNKKSMDNDNTWTSMQAKLVEAVNKYRDKLRPNKGTKIYEALHSTDPAAVNAWAEELLSTDSDLDEGIFCILPISLTRAIIADYAGLPFTPTYSEYLEPSYLSLPESVIPGSDFIYYIGIAEPTIQPKHCGEEEPAELPKFFESAAECVQVVLMRKYKMPESDASTVIKKSPLKEIFDQDEEMAAHTSNETWARIVHDWWLRQNHTIRNVDFLPTQVESH